MPYNHAYTIAFSLTSQHPEGEDVTPAMFSAALRRRADDLDATVTPAQPAGEWDEAVGKPYDTYEEEPSIPDDCVAGMHSWINETGKLPANTACTHCGETYGDPS